VVPQGLEPWTKIYLSFLVAILRKITRYQKVTIRFHRSYTRPVVMRPWPFYMTNYYFVYFVYYC